MPNEFVVHSPLEFLAVLVIRNQEDRIVLEGLDVEGLRRSLANIKDNIGDTLQAIEDEDNPFDPGDDVQEILNTYHQNAVEYLNDPSSVRCVVRP